jgi:hypothetical protein
LPGVASENSQRSYRAPCPGCGAPVDFRSAQSAHAICGYCRSMVVRDGEVLKRIGKMSELFDDHSPLQLQTTGVWNGQPFTLIGRLQYQYAEGTWTEWHALLQDGRSAFLSEDNGAYVFGLPLPQQAVAAAEVFRVGARTAIHGQPFTVASNQPVALMSAQGELPHLPVLGQSFVLVELRSQSADRVAAAEVISIDYGQTPPALSKGQAVLLDDLQLKGLLEASSKAEKGRAFNCPNCGTSLTAVLDTTQSMTCRSCNCLIDLSQGIGGELKHATQDEPVQPLIPLGSTGTLQGAEWQVVGWQHRMGHDPADPDEHFGWDEYLLYNRQRGFTFLVDSTEGWSLVKPATGAPVLGSDGQSASYLGMRYPLKESYQAEANHVLGEFYWQVHRGQQTRNRDYASGKSLLSSEQSAHELTWSVGGQIASDAVATAFKLQDRQALLARTDVKPFAASGGFWLRPDFWVFVVIVLIMLSVTTCSGNCDPASQDCSRSTRTSGGSFGGFSTGGGHK